MIYLLRHGLDDERYIGGWSDIDLIEEGIIQVNNTVDKMIRLNLKIDKIIVSNVRRAITTADIVSKRLNIEEYEISDLFKEQNKGLLNGMDKILAKEKFEYYTGNNIQIDTVYPEGESLLDLYKRIKDIMEYIKSLPDNTLIITHRGVINMIYYILNNIDVDMNKERFEVTHASLHELDKDNMIIRKVI